MEYKSTLNLPQTDFPIRANSAKVEEECLKLWEELDVYHQLLKNTEHRAQSTEHRYILHDGPPYPNGDIHLGHALNKILKDIVVKYKTQCGFYSPYVPGWDCHGLPIETQLLKEIGDKRKDMSVTDFRQKCKEYALKYVDLQRAEFKKLGIFGEWDKPYLTIDHSYEEKIVELFGILAERGYVYRGLKPIHWCPTDQTALAEAELEYEDERSPSIYVKFALRDPHSAFATIIKNPNLPTNLPWSVVIWTTTPWTLPANVAVAAHPEMEYVFLCTGSEVLIVAEGLLEDFKKHVELKEHKILDKTKGKMLEGLLLKHPFLEKEVPVILGELVTEETGTGFVHIAPGHGAEDYQVGLKYKLPIVMPVNGRGYFDDTVPDFIKGKHYDESNKLITEKMKENGTLLKLEFFKHSYPHCWRCKKPVIFRATEQWFISVDRNNLRENALKAIARTKWYPGWGENRIRGMVLTRPDWCVSRQRSWGVPVPAFYCTECGKPQITGIFNRSIRDLIRVDGTNGWFSKEAADILPEGTQCPDCQGLNFQKETDILDVWFESGSSFAAVLNGPANLYLEGSDQHRGWFQSSLLIGLGQMDRAPFDAVLTHGFTIDDHGKKMSKSLGNVVDPQAVVKKYGADVLRLWVASTDFRNDMAASDKILKQVQDAYLKIRNTCRFLLSNLNDFDLTTYQPNHLTTLLEIDRWILLRLQRLIEKVKQAYDEFEFHIVYHSIYDFCVNDLSALYLDMSKDRLYCGAKNSHTRRSAQFALSEILNTLIRLLSPILSYTAENIYSFSKPKEKSVFLLGFPEVKKEYLDEQLGAKWDILLSVREKVYKVLEEARNEKTIASSVEAAIEIFAEGEELKALQSVEDLLKMFFIVSQVKLYPGKADPQVAHALGHKCERCWMWSETRGRLCDRCAAVVG